METTPSAGGVSSLMVSYTCSADDLEVVAAVAAAATGALEGLLGWSLIGGGLGGGGAVGRMGLVVAILAGRLADLPLPEILALALDVGASCPVEGESGEAWNNPEDRAAGGWGALPFFVEPDLNKGIAVKPINIATLAEITEMGCYSAKKALSYPDPENGIIWSRFLFYPCLSKHHGW